MRRGRKSEEGRKETMVPSKSVPFRSIHYSIPFRSDPRTRGSPKSQTKSKNHKKEGKKRGKKRGKKKVKKKNALSCGEGGNEEDFHQCSKGNKKRDPNVRLSQVTESLLRSSFSATLSWPLNNAGRRADTPRLLHDSVSFRAQAAALATLEMPTLDFVGNHLVEQRSHLVHAASTSGAVQSGGGGDRFAVLCRTVGDGRRVKAAGGT
jgi:hypothetical protein